MHGNSKLRVGNIATPSCPSCCCDAENAMTSNNMHHKLKRTCVADVRKTVAHSKLLRYSSQYLGHSTNLQAKHGWHTKG